MKVINDLGRDASGDVGRTRSRPVDGWEAAFLSQLLVADFCQSLPAGSDPKPKFDIDID